MKKKRIDWDMPIGKLTRVADFLPPPDQLRFPDPPVKVTIALDQSSVKFFKEQALKHGFKYQRMIRTVLDRYVARYSSDPLKQK
ncbi:MAG: CopG family transcriptional regulator [Candidatus Omnitrophica bacterium]|nr:CopG family transcriptional regulator [Candidatus Omnitrophota bacterium]